jgi:type I restriction enzyme, S subunit
MSRYKPYPSYKASEVEWLGEVPEHWEAGSIKRLCSVKRGASPRPIEDPKYFDDDGEYAWVRIADVTASQGTLRETTQRLSSLGKSLSVPLKPGELFLSIAGSVGKPIITDIKCCIHDGFVYFKGYKESTKLLYWVFASGQPYLGLGKMGTQLNLNTDTVGDIKIAFMSLSEQTAIANFLDRETAKIDTLIEKQQQLIELLKEKIISLAMNEQINGQGDFVQIEHLISLVARPVILENDNEYEALGLYNRGRGLFHKPIKLGKEMGDSDFYCVEEGDLILSGQFAWEGAVALAQSSENGCVVSHRYPVLRGKSIQTEYLLALLMTDFGDFLLNESSRGAAGRNRPLNVGLLLDEKIRVPSNEVQNTIRNLIHIKAMAERKANKAIDLLKERRTALISAAVTGKIDVRKAV